MALLSRWLRRARLAALSRSAPGRLRGLGERRALAAFRAAVRDVPAYGRLLRDAGVEAGGITTVEGFRARCPVLDKASTFGAFALEDLGP